MNLHEFVNTTEFKTAETALKSIVHLCSIAVLVSVFWFGATLIIGAHKEADHYFTFSVNGLKGTVQQFRAERSKQADFERRIKEATTQQEFDALLRELNAAPIQQNEVPIHLHSAQPDHGQSL